MYQHQRPTYIPMSEKSGNIAMANTSKVFRASLSPSALVWHALAIAPGSINCINVHHSTRPASNVPHPTFTTVHCSPSPFAQPCGDRGDRRNNESTASDSADVAAGVQPRQQALIDACNPVRRDAVLQAQNCGRPVHFAAFAASSLYLLVYDNL